jgi:hypothetical protein
MPPKFSQTYLLESTQLSSELIGEALCTSPHTTYICQTNFPTALISALYGPRYPAHCSFDVLIGTVPGNNGSNRYITQAIVYTDAQYRNWKLAKNGQGEWGKPYRSVEEFVKELRKEFGTLAGKFPYESAEGALLMKKLESMGGTADANVRDALALPPLEQKTIGDVQQAGNYLELHSFL